VLSPGSGVTLGSVSVRGVVWQYPGRTALSGEGVRFRTTSGNGDSGRRVSVFVSIHRFRSRSIPFWIFLLNLRCLKRSH